MTLLFDAPLDRPQCFQTGAFFFPNETFPQSKYRNLKGRNTDFLGSKYTVLPIYFPRVCEYIAIS
ncbi:MAG: hypothetical protein AMK69_08220 [Nitrospira bacterium SG8_3]|nr:MAG: hypothetical protein AMK69_08220 [Nitrospira bacterium SG8_3]